VTSQCPIKQHCPRERSKCGRRERESRREGRREQSLRENIPSRVVAVEDILVFWKASLFAGRRPNEDLGRSVSGVVVPPLQTNAPMTADVRRSPRRGTPSACTTKCMHPSRAREIVASEQGTPSFARSFGPCTSILTMLRGGNSRGWGVGIVITVGQTHASERNHHWGRYLRT
jgi:hypothetical protein